MIQVFLAGFVGGVGATIGAKWANEKLIPFAVKKYNEFKKAYECANLKHENGVGAELQE